MVKEKHWRRERLGVAAAAAGCLIGLLAWPATPQDRFLVVLLGVVSPFVAYALVRLIIFVVAQLAAAVRRHNWRQFSLRGLLVFTILCAIGALIFSWTRPDLRYRRMRERQQLAAAVESLGGSLDGNLIRLNGQVIYDRDLGYLASFPAAKDIQGVNLNGTGVTDEVTKYLIRFPAVRSISMDGCLAITDGVLKHLHGNRKLRFLRAYDTQLTQTGVDAIHRANHQLRVDWGYSSHVMKGPFDERATHPAAAYIEH